ncbi:hypothetical protein D3C80_2182990 [compost metagenome]
MAQLSEAGRQFARQRHDWNIAAQQLENVHMRLNQAQPAEATQLAGGWFGRSAK